MPSVRYSQVPSTRARSLTISSADRELHPSADRRSPAIKRKEAADHRLRTD
jgi:hypothetical protein